MRYRMNVSHLLCVISLYSLELIGNADQITMSIEWTVDWVKHAIADAKRIWFLFLSLS